MVLQILSNIGVGDLAVDSRSFENARVANSRELKNLRRRDATTTKYDLSGDVDSMLFLCVQEAGTCGNPLAISLLHSYVLYEDVGEKNKISPTCIGLVICGR